MVGAEESFMIFGWRHGGTKFHRDAPTTTALLTHSRELLNPKIKFRTKTSEPNET